MLETAKYASTHLLEDIKQLYYVLPLVRFFYYKRVHKIHCCRCLEMQFKILPAVFTVTSFVGYVVLNSTLLHAHTFT